MHFHPNEVLHEGADTWLHQHTRPLVTVHIVHAARSRPVIEFYVFASVVLS